MYSLQSMWQPLHVWNKALSLAHARDTTGYSCAESFTSQVNSFTLQQGYTAQSDFNNVLYIYKGSFSARVRPVSPWRRFGASRLSRVPPLARMRSLKSSLAGQLRPEPRACHWWHLGISWLSPDLWPHVRLARVAGRSGWLL